MQWTTWKASGAGWVNQGREASTDPYLVWADLTSFRSFTAPGASAPERITALLELKAGATAQRLQSALGDDEIHIPAPYLRADTRFVTASLSRAAARQLSAPGNAWVERLVLSMPVLASRRLARRVPASTAVEDAAQQLSAGGTLLGVIDTGCPFAHQALLVSPLEPRVLSLWDQDPSPAFGVVPSVGTVKADFGYGRAVNRQGLKDLMTAACVSAGGPVDEDRCYEQAGATEMRRSATHGGAVLGQMAGPMRLGDRIEVAPGRPASRFKRGNRPSDLADVVFVQLPRDTWADPSGLGLGASVLDGLHHILSCGGSETRQVLVNLSCATYTGPHDGSTVLDAALAELTARVSGRPGLRLVVPAGNARQRQWRANGVVSPGESANVTWRVAPGSEAPAFLEVWVDVPPEQVRFDVKPPRGPSSGPLPMDVQVLCGDGAAHAVAVQHAGGVRGGVGTMLLLALPPATSADAAGPGGDWLLTVGAPGSEAVHVNVYVARSETEMGAPQRHRPSKLVDPSCDPYRYLREAEEDPLPSGTRPVIQVVREGTVGSPASCAGVVAVGGLRFRESALGPSKLGMQPVPESGDGLKGNAWAALMDESKAVPGIPGIGSRSAGVSRLRGTSFAAPQVARTLADISQLLPKGPRGEPPEQKPWPRTKAADPRKGQGCMVPRAG